MAAQDRIQEEFNKVIRGFKKKLDNDKLYDEICKFTSAEDVYKATDKLQTEKGNNTVLHCLSKIDPFLQRMQEYSEVIKIFTQVKPDILALIWGPIRLLLQWTSVLKKSHDAIINAISEIGGLLPEFLEVNEIYDQNVHLIDVLVLFFQDLLDFYVVALQFFSLSTWRFMFEALWPKQKHKIELVVTHINRHVSLMRQEVTLQRIREEHQLRLEALAHFEKMENANIRAEHERIRNTISPRLYNDQLNWYHGRVCEGTNQWLMNNPIFTKWLDRGDDTARLLWLKGIPGSGKTFLAGAAIDTVMPLARTTFAFLSHVNASDTTAKSVLHSLVFQLTLKDVELQAILCQISNDNFGINSTAAASVLSTLLSCLDIAYIIIDGIDEIDKIERERLLSHMVDISKACVNVRILISSRSESDIVAKINHCFLSIQVNDHNTDSIKAFVARSTDSFLASRNFLDGENDEIEALLAPIAVRAKGMFLYAKILLECIELLPDVESITAELKVLPQDLHDAYGRILSRINGIRSTTARQNARQIIGWIGCSPTPLTVKEIEQMLSLKPSHVRATTAVKASLNLVELCGPIVEVEGGYARFVHFTVKEYMFNENIVGYVDLIEMNLDLAERCIYYLCQECFDEELTVDELKQHLLKGSYRLLYYVMTQWVRLTTQSIALQDSHIPPPTLVTALELLASMRSSFNFSDPPPFFGQILSLELDSLDQQNYGTQMLRHVVHFDEQLSGSAVPLRKIAGWKWQAPLTIIQMASRIHDLMDDILCAKDRHTEDCSSDLIVHHYGINIFKCQYLDCPDFRQGFPTKASQKAHEKLHTKPWKCNEPNCEYADIGFVSQTMRDIHVNVHRQTHRPQVDPSTDLHEQADIKALAVDFISLNRFSEIESLLPCLERLSEDHRITILRAAISHGASDLMDTLLRPQFIPHDSLPSLLVLSIKKSNLKALQILKSDFRESCADWAMANESEALLCALVVSDSTEARRECEKLILDETLSAYRNGQYTWMWLRPAFGREVIGQTSNSKVKELRLRSFWEKLMTVELPEIGLAEAEAQHIMPKYRAPQISRLNIAKLGYVLAISHSSSSLVLVKALLRYGVPIDYRLSERYMTGLHHTARTDDMASAKKMEFLLYHGADPETQAGRSKLKCSEEKGAKGIAKWLNISWEELVERVKADRARGYCPPEYRLDFDDI